MTIMLVPIMNNNNLIRKNSWLIINAQSTFATNFFRFLLNTPFFLRNTTFYTISTYLLYTSLRTSIIFKPSTTFIFISFAKL